MDHLTKQGRQGGIQSLRAFACMLVLFQHSVFFATYTKGLDYHPYLAVNFGRTGVSLFFVISGYVMGGCMREGNMFILHRIARIFPPFWIAMALSYFMLLHANTGWHFDWQSVFLLPSSALNSTYEIPYWTLCYEMAFYVIVYLMVLARLRRKGVVAFCLLWVIAIILTDAYHPFGFIEDPAATAIILQPGSWILLTPYPIFFIAGLLASVLMVDIERRITTGQLLCLAVMLWGASNGFSHSSSVPMFLVQSFAFCCALLSLKDAKFARLATTFGDRSYGVYLMHMVVIVAVAAALRPHSDHIRLSVLWAILMVSGTIGGLIFGHIEHWIHMRYVKPILRARLTESTVPTAQS